MRRAFLKGCMALPLRQERDISPEEQPSKWGSSKALHAVAPGDPSTFTYQSHPRLLLSSHTHFPAGSQTHLANPAPGLLYVLPFSPISSLLPHHSLAISSETFSPTPFFFLINFIVIWLIHNVNFCCTVRWFCYTYTYIRTSLVAQMVKRLPTMWEIQIRSLGWEDPLEKEMATHSSTLVWKISWTEERWRLQSMGSQRVGHDWASSLSLSFIHISSLFSFFGFFPHIGHYSLFFLK